MQEAIDLKQALRVCNKIISHGQRIDGAYKLGDLTAESDYDGYTLTLSDHAVKLHIFFHNKHQLDCKRAIELDDFLQKIAKLDKKNI
ncbi:DUF3081 family protein [Thalassotalea mangrovi]|uniref:DUF3081 domain-containing protein n=1 Tax=Thalassotalea mangrovi TaxID=2572245 RepID=A0A4U1B1M4_9GAMM|nr:DUF3081 family protein [Thalassotalea mangrovi]TKB43247.1 DUF3081 domain-containing protein [Thalassotalea mangrovi]